MNSVTPYTKEEIREFLKITDDAYQDEQSISLRKLMTVKDRIDIFKGIEAEELKAIIYDLKFIKYNFGDTIIKQNEISSEIFFIITGVCKVIHNGKEVGVLKSKDIFGEAGAIFEIKRNATVRCASNDVTLLSFCIDNNNMEFCADSLAILYKNLAFQINHKLQELNYHYSIKGHI